MQNNHTTAIFVIGGSPAILSESLAAYVRDYDTYPTQLHIITTLEGKKRLVHRFLDEGGWQDFVAEYPEYQSVVFDDGCIEVAGELQDISSEEDNRVMMEAIFRVVQEASEQGSHIIASIAGGRKTMSYYLGLAMSMFASSGDKMTHVLVPPEWEFDRDFLFPKRTEWAQLTLLETPFLRIGDFLASELKKVDVNRMIDATQTAIDQAAKPMLEVNYDTREVSFLGKTVRLPVREFTFYRFFLQQKERHCQHQDQPSCEACHDCYLDWRGLSSKRALDELHDIRAIYGKGTSDERVKAFQKTWRSFDYFEKNFSEAKNRINSTLKKGLPVDRRVEQVLIENVKNGGYSIIGIKADKSQIVIKRG